MLLLRTATGLDIDVALGALPFEERTVERASEWSWGTGPTLVTCSADDLLVHKAFAGRERDWADVDGILTRQHGRLNLALVHDELSPLRDLKEEPDSLAKFHDRVDRIDRRLRGA